MLMLSGGACMQFMLLMVQSSGTWSKLKLKHFNKINITKLILVRLPMEQTFCSLMILTMMVILRLLTVVVAH